jgi:poly(A) polymerase
MQVTHDNLSNVLQCVPHFKLLSEHCSSQNAYLVGGAVRDALVGRPITDLDLIFPSDPSTLARSFARRIGGHWFWLDRERRQSRVVVNHEPDCPDFDFAPFRAPDLERDLLDRDFSINAIAQPLSEPCSADSLVDPCDGLDDLRKKILRMVSRNSFTHDPLRMIKGVRHATVLGLDIEPVTFQHMQAEVTNLYSVAHERIRTEVWKIFSSDHIRRGLHLLSQSGLGNYLFSNDFSENLPLLTSCLENCRKRWELLARQQPVVANWLIREVEQGLSCETLILWTRMLSLLESKLPVCLAEEWLLGRKARAVIEGIATLDETSLQDLTMVASRQRAFAWWAVQLRLDPQLLLLALATVDVPKVSAYWAGFQTWVPLAAQLDGQRPVDLVDGDWLRNELGLEDGPEMANAFQLLRDAEIYGQVDDVESARTFLAQKYRNKD